MKRIISMLFIALIVALFGALVFLFFPLYGSSKLITRLKSDFNIVSKTSSHVKVLTKPELYAGIGAIVPLNSLVIVGESPVDIDMSDRTLIRFTPNSRFKIIKLNRNEYSIKLIKGAFLFNRENKGLVSVRTALGDIQLKGTQGMISSSQILITKGNVIIDDQYINAGEAFSDEGKKPAGKAKTAELKEKIKSIGKSDQKSVFTNMFRHIPVFRKRIIDNSTAFVSKKQTPDVSKKISTAPETSTKSTSIKVNAKSDTDWQNFLLDLFKKKIDCYVDMYVLRLSITTDRYFNNDLSFPPSIESLNDEDAKKRTNDPWGTRYLYTLGGPAGFNLRSAGPDKHMNTDDDIVLFTMESSQTFWNI